MKRFNTERTLGVAVGLFVIAVAVAIALGSVALVTAVSVNRAVEKPTVKESRVRISRSITRYTRPQLRELLGRLLEAATPRQQKVLKRRGLVRTRNRPSGSPTVRRRIPNGVRTEPGSRTRPGRARRPVLPIRTPRPTPAPEPTAGPAAVAPTPAAPVPKPVATVTVPLPLPIKVCTALVGINCP